MSVTGLSKINGTHPDLQPWFHWLVRLAVAQGWDVDVTSGFRSMEEQERLYNRWKQGLQSLHVARPGCSQHNYGLAVDMVIAGDFWGPRQKALGFEWSRQGGQWSVADPVHFGVFWTRPRGC